MSYIDRLSHKSYNQNNKLLRLYETVKGKVPFHEWLSSLKDKKIRARIRQHLDRLELGHYGDSKFLGNGIYELRLHFGAGYRIYFVNVDEIIILLLCGGNKSSQVKDIKKANEYWEDVKGRCYE